MKKILLTVFYLLFIHILSSGEIDNSITDIWGYILHTSKLNNNYIKRTIPSLKAVSITGYTLKKTGQLKYNNNRLISTVLKNAEEHHVKIYPLVNFKSSSDGHTVLNSIKLRNLSIKNIRNLVIKNNFNGVHIDFEYLPPSDSTVLAEFLRILRLNMKNKKITMAIFPQVGFPQKWSGFHNLQVISPYIDMIVLMCYDYHRPGTGPGPVTDLNWSEKNIKEALKYLKSKQVWLGIPAYGYKWSNNKKTTAISSRLGKKLAEKHGYRRHPSGNIFISFRDSAGRHNIYFSDKLARKNLKQLASKYNLRGVAIWRLGFEE